jgi:phosphate transport system substrate-binding protein
MTRKSYQTWVYLILGLLGLMGFAACSGQPIGTSSSNDSSVGGGNIVRGAGATFPKPIYEKWASEFGKINPTVRIDYQANGSGAGVTAIQNQTVDFGASDIPMSDADLQKAKGDVLHVPTVLGAAVLTYNVPSVKEELRLSPEIIAGIYLGKIKKWNDPRVKADNQAANLPDADIVPVFRADASGTSDVFTGFLSNANPEWKEKVGRGVQPSWITGVGIGAKGNDGVMGQVKQTPNTVGYVELAFAKINNLPTAQIKNAAGNFVAANFDSVQAAASDSAAKVPEDLRTELINAPGANAYPISSYTYILVYRDQKDAAKGKNIVDFLWWATHDGQTMVKDLYYAPLPQEIVAKVETRLKLVSNNGKPLKQ